MQRAFLAMRKEPSSLFIHKCCYRTGFAVMTAKTYPAYLPRFVTGLALVKTNVRLAERAKRLWCTEGAAAASKALTMMSLVIAISGGTFLGLAHLVGSWGCAPTWASVHRCGKPRYCVARHK